MNEIAPHADRVTKAEAAEARADAHKTAQPSDKGLTPSARRKRQSARHEREDHARNGPVVTRHDDAERRPSRRLPVAVKPIRTPMEIKPLRAEVVR